MTAGVISNRTLIRSIKKTAMAYAFIAVPILSFIIFLLVPMVVSFYWSLTDYNGIQPAKFIGLQNYVELFTHDKYFLVALKNTTLLVLMGMGVGPTLGMITAILLNQKVRFQSLFRTAYYLPVMTSLVVVSTIWVMLYNQNGLFNTLLNGLGINSIGWLSNPKYALVSVAIASIWQGFGFETVIFLAALQSIPRELYEAAMMDGANGIQQFFHITVPSLRPVIAFVYIYGIIGSYQIFDQVFVMTSGGPIHSTSTIVYFLFSKFQDLRLGYASAIAYVLFAILVVFSYMAFKMEKE